MPQRKKPRIRHEDIQEAVEGLKSVISFDAMSEIDKFFATNLLESYGKWCAVEKAAWRSLDEDGLTERRDSGAANNRHRRMTKSEALDIFKMATAAKTSIASQISKFAKNRDADAAREDDDGFEDFVG